jgi:hypothetical protein
LSSIGSSSPLLVHPIVTTLPLPFFLSFMLKQVPHPFFSQLNPFYLISSILPIFPIFYCSILASPHIPATGYSVLSIHEWTDCYLYAVASIMILLIKQEHFWSRVTYFVYYSSSWYWVVTPRYRPVCVISILYIITSYYSILCPSQMDKAAYRTSCQLPERCEPTTWWLV